MLARQVRPLFITDAQPAHQTAEKINARNGLGPSLHSLHLFFRSNQASPPRPVARRRGLSEVHAAVGACLIALRHVLRHQRDEHRRPGPFGEAIAGHPAQLLLSLAVPAGQDS